MFFQQRFFDNYKFVVYKLFCKIYVHIIWINNLVLLFFHSDRLNVTSHNFGWQGIHKSQGCGKSDQRGENPPENHNTSSLKNDKFLTVQEPVLLFLVCTSVCGRAWVCSKKCGAIIQQWGSKKWHTMWTVERKYHSKEDYGIANWPGRALGLHLREFTDFVQESMFQSTEGSRRFGWDGINLWHRNCDVMILNYAMERWQNSFLHAWTFYAVFSIHNCIITGNERIAH